MAEGKEVDLEPERAAATQIQRRNVAVSAPVAPIEGEATDTP